MNGAILTRAQRRRQSQRQNAEKTQVNLLRAMSKEMPPTQAIVFMSYFNQFPERFRPGHDNYFFPLWAITCRQMGIKRHAFWKMTDNLVRLGLLEEGWEGIFGISWLGRLLRDHEYRIAFDELKKYEA